MRSEWARSQRRFSMGRDHNYFESWAREMKMRPVCKVQDRDGDILVADSGEPFYGTNADGVLGRWYRTGFAINRDQVWLGNYCEYDANSFADESKRRGQEIRINEAVVAGRETLRLTKEVGLYDGREASLSSQLN